MAKTAKVKKRAVSFRSRAARRGESPPAKDLPTKAPVEETDYKPWLHSVQGAGVVKKKKAKPLSRQQRMRQQKALEKADAIVNRTERKVADSKARSKKVQARAKDWEELNEKMSGKQTISAATVPKVADPELDDGSDESETEDVALPDLEEPLPMHVTDDDAAVELNAQPTAAVPEEVEDEVT